MSYCLDLSRISIVEYKALLKQQTLLPGRRMLLDGIDAHFSALAAQNVATLAELRQRISTPQKCATLGSATGIPEEYLVLLKRESGSLEQKPVLLAAFPGVEEQLVSVLRENGILNSRDYYERGAQQGELFCLCDLVRINGVGALAARAFYEAGFRSVQDVANAYAVEMLRRISEVNAQRNYYKATLSEKDMQFCIDFAKLLIRYGD